MKAIKPIISSHIDGVIMKPPVKVPSFILDELLTVLHINQGCFNNYENRSCCSGALS